MDIVADSLIRIKNSYLSYKKDVLLPYSKLVLAICTVLKEEGYIESFKEEAVDKTKKLNIVAVLRYQNKKGAVTGVTRISKPGLRVYKGSKALPRVLNGLGIALISTPKGVMTDKKARKAGLGGEVMAFVW